MNLKNQIRKTILNKTKINMHINNITTTKDYTLNLSNTKDELISIVDINDNILFCETRKKMRMKNLIFRTTNIIIFNPKTNQFTLQIRSDNKEYCPGFIDITTGGIVSCNEDVSQSAIRELNEEMGIVVDLSQVEFCGKKLFSTEKVKSWDYVYYLEYDGEYSFNDGEVKGVLKLSEDEIYEMIMNKEKITPDSIDSFMFYIEWRKRRNDNV